MLVNNKQCFDSSPPFYMKINKKHFIILAYKTIYSQFLSIPNKG